MSFLQKSQLSPAVKQMYASEKLMNFRWISRIVAQTSDRVLTAEDVASIEIENELAELGQFAEVASSRGELPIRFLFDNITSLLQSDFPLEGYDALQGCTLVFEFFGSVARLHGFAAYRPKTKQLILAFSGTTNMKQALFDVKTHYHILRSGDGAAHAGFWEVYKGTRERALEGIKKGLKDHEGEVAEIVVTGHSLGGVTSCLFMRDLLAEKISLPNGVKLKLASFGAPRPGNIKLAKHWLELVKNYRARYGYDAFTEFSVKGYNDGVPSLPPLSLGFRHFTRNPLYYYQGRLYRIPESHCEDALFVVNHPHPDSEVWPYPKGGHNYYNGRDMEKVSRRILWLDKVMAGSENWEQRYMDRVQRKVAQQIEKERTNGERRSSINC